MTTEVVEAPAAPAAAPVAATPPAAPAAAPAPAAESTILQVEKPLAETIPEKHRVMRADGALDEAATLTRVEKHRASLESKIGTGDMRPDSAADYKLELPEAFKPMIATLPEEGVKAFQEEAFGAGLTQKQYEFVMAKYLEVAPTLVQGARSIDRDAAVTELKATWPDQATFDLNVANASKAVQGYGSGDAQGILTDYGNDPRIVRMMAKIGAEMGEASAPREVGLVSGETADSLRKSEAYMNAKHSDHAKVSAQVSAFDQRTYGTGRPGG